MTQYTWLLSYPDETGKLREIASCTSWEAVQAVIRLMETGPESTRHYYFSSPTERVVPGREYMINVPPSSRPPLEEKKDYYDELSDLIEKHPPGLPGAGRFGSR